MIYYSASTKGFYKKKIHGKNIPEDAREITEEYHISLLEGQSQGLDIVPDDTGYPVLKERQDSGDNGGGQKNARQKLFDDLDKLDYEFSDGRVIDTRPKDEPNFRITIDFMEKNNVSSTLWRMKNNQVETVTLEELKMARDEAIQKALQMWNDYNANNPNNP